MAEENSGALGTPKVTLDEVERNSISFLLFVEILRDKGFRIQDPVKMRRELGRLEKRVNVPAPKLVALVRIVLAQFMDELDELAQKPVPEEPKSKKGESDED